MDTVEAIFRVLVVGLLFGAGVPSLFAVGMLLHAEGSGDSHEDGTITAPKPFLSALAWLFFAIAALLIVVGLLWITRGTIEYYTGVQIFPFG